MTTTIYDYSNNCSTCKLKIDSTSDGKFKCEFSGDSYSEPITDCVDWLQIPEDSNNKDEKRNK